METGQQKGSLIGHTSDVVGLAFSPDEVTLASGSEDGSIRFWRLKKRREREDHVIPAGYTASHSVRTAVRWLPSIAYRRTVGARNSGSTAIEEDFIFRAGLSGDGDMFAIREILGSIRLMDLSTGDTTITLTGHTDI